MDTKLLTEYIFLDTSVYESENFVEGKKIKQLFEFAKEGHIKIVIPDITYQETLGRIKAHLRAALKYVDQVSKDYYRHLKVLRNIESHKSKFPLPKVGLQNDFEKVKMLFDNMLSYGNKILVANEVSHKHVFERYFLSRPPFHNQNKKSEFPDAFALASIEAWCEEWSRRCYLLTLDKDMLSYESEYLFPISNLGELIDVLNRSAEERVVRIQKVDEAIKTLSDEFLHDLERELERLLEDAVLELDRDAEFEVESVYFIDVTNLAIERYSLLHIDDRDANVEIVVSFDFNAHFEITDYSKGFYDKEDGVWLGDTQVEKNISGSLQVDVNVVVIHSTKKETSIQQIMILDINGGEGLDISTYF